ncbi:MAG: hypothetical protein WBA49_13360 [Rhodanobacter lindaniclasticus]
MNSGSDQPIAGMTVNERLYHFGLIGEFDAAIRACNAELAISILIRAKFTREQATPTVGATLSDPKRYGY